jgi:DNA replication protein DnaC
MRPLWIAIDSKSDETRVLATAGRKKLRARYLALHDLAFLAKGVNPLFIGIPGTGKTFLARALAYRVCQAARRVRTRSSLVMRTAVPWVSYLA